MVQTTLSGGISKKRAKPFLKWAGGKGNLIKYLKSFFPSNFNTYFEPFLGGGAIFFHLNPEKAMINDFNEELIDVYVEIKNNPEKLMIALDKLQPKVDDKDFFYSIRAKKTSRMSTLNRVCRTIFLNKTCFNGMYRVNSKGEFNVPKGSMKNPRLYNRENLVACSESLQETEIVSGDYKNVLKKVKKNDFVYLDPPYDPLSKTSSFTSYTKNDFGKDEQLELANLFEALNKKGAILMLNNSDTEYTRELYKNYRIEIIKAPRFVAAKGKSRKPVNELVVMNYE